MPFPINGISSTGQEKELEFDLERAEYWIGKGARPSDRVASLIKGLRKQAA
jgi:small subunit ribosomal protein S16